MDKSKSTCLNCNHSLVEGDKFCSHCGQKTDAHLLTLGELLANFWSTLTNLDNSAFNTLKYIWTPWKLTRYYVEGKKKSFLNPVRIFIITMILHFGVLISSFDLSSFTLSQDLYTDYEQNKLYEQYQDAKKQTDTLAHASFISLLETTLFKDGAEMSNDTVTNFNFNGVDFRLKAKDIIELPIDSIYTKYGYTKFIDKLIAKQLIKSFKNPDGTIRYVLGNLIWAILLTILILAGFFKLIYWRKKLTYVEHLIFLMNVHSLAFIVNTILLLIFSLKLVNWNGEDAKINLSLSFFLIPTIIFFIAMYKYYEQSFLKTSIKSMLSSIVYLTANLFFIILTAFLSFLLF